MPKVSTPSVSTTPIKPVPKPITSAIKEEEPKVVSTAPRPKISLKSVGINKILNPKIEESKEEKHTPLERQAFNETDLLTAWKEYAEQIKERDLDIYTTLTRHTPKLEGQKTVLLKLDNKAQEHEVTEIKVELLGFIRHRLNNFEVELKTFIEKGAEEKGLYTSADKFKKMAEKNPMLEELKKRLDLDLGF